MYCQKCIKKMSDEKLKKEYAKSIKTFRGSKLKTADTDLWTEMIIRGFMIKLKNVK